MSDRAPAHRVRAYVGLGANLGDARATLAWAVKALAGLAGVRLRGVSPLYVTAPWGVTDQPDFHNAVVALDVPAGPDPVAGAIALLGELKMLERLAGRRRRGRWGPRELDLDLLVFGRHRIAVDRPTLARSIDAASDPRKAARRLEVPHRDAGDRLFVLAPLADLAPRLVPPGWDETVETRRQRVASTESPDAVRVAATWDDEARAGPSAGTIAGAMCTKMSRLCSHDRRRSAGNSRCRADQMSPADPPVVALPTSARWLALALLAAIASGNLLTPLLPQIRDEFGVSLTTAGFIVAAFGLARLIVDIPSALLADRFGLVGSPSPAWRC